LILPILKRFNYDTIGQWSLFCSGGIPKPPKRLSHLYFIFLFLATRKIVDNMLWPIVFNANDIIGFQGLPDEAFFVPILINGIWFKSE